MDLKPEATTIILPPRLLGTVDYYAALAAFEHAIIDTTMRFDKRCKSTHRTPIADANGTMMLTVPIVKPASLSKAMWSDVVVSDHNGWWNIAMTALRSGYGRTPYYEFYEDDFATLINRETAGRKLIDFDSDLDSLVRRLGGITTKVDHGDPRLILGNRQQSSDAVADYRSRSVDFTSEVPYYQVRADRHGFMAGLSIVDLLFNMGPETPLILREMTSTSRS